MVVILNNAKCLQMYAVEILSFSGFCVLHCWLCYIQHSVLYRLAKILGILFVLIFLGRNYVLSNAFIIPTI